MGTHPLTRERDWDIGRHNYTHLGPLTDSDLELLAAKPSDYARQQWMSRIYGYHGGMYAWCEYLKLQGRHNRCKHRRLCGG